MFNFPEKIKKLVDLCIYGVCIMSWKEKVFLKKNSVSAFISSLQKMDTDTGLSVFIIFKGYTTSTFIKLN